MNYRKQSLSFLSDKKGSTVIDWLRIQLFLRFFINIIIFLYDIFSAVYMFLNQCGYPVTETGCHQIKRCLRTSQLPRFMLPSDMMMSTDIQFTNSSVSALDICLMSFGDARPMSARLRIRLTTVPWYLPGLRLGYTMCRRDLPGELTDFTEDSTVLQGYT